MDIASVLTQCFCEMTTWYNIGERICGTHRCLSFVFTDAEYQVYPNGTCLRAIKSFKNSAVSQEEQYLRLNEA